MTLVVIFHPKMYICFSLIDKTRELDKICEKISYKIREHSLAKIPYIIVCGKKEIKNKTVSVRKLGSEKQETVKREILIKNMIRENKLPLN